MKQLFFALLAILTWPLLAGAQTTVNINLAKLTWQWTQGAPPNDGLPTEFRIKCGQVSKTYTKITIIADPAARQADVRSAIQGSGSWYCAVSAANQYGESGVSNEVSFFAWAPVSPPSNLGVQ